MGNQKNQLPQSTERHLPFLDESISKSTELQGKPKATTDFLPLAAMKVKLSMAWS